jgi:cell wall-associated NlpC family hydrolase
LSGAKSQRKAVRVKRFVIAAVSLALLTVSAAPGIAAARPAGNQKFVDAVVARALSQRGVPFAYGGGDAKGPTEGTAATPDPAPATAAADPLAGVLTPSPAPAPPPARVVGFDASGLMVYAFGAGAGVKLPRTSGEQCKAGMQVPPAQALPGDLLCYGPDGSQSVALFIGNGQMVEVAGTGVTVSKVRTNGMTPYLTRIIA